jgi:sugar/nucleoside kinase (ribokinase family)
MQPEIDFLAIGELLADVTSVDYVSSLSEAKTFRLHSGGSPANVCGNLKWLGVHASLISCVGYDSIGDYLIEEINKIGLNVEFIKRTKGFPTSIVLVGRSKGTPDFIAYRSADTQLSEIDPAILKQSQIIHSCAFALSKNPGQHHILNALSLASSMGKTISIDWNYAPSMWDRDGNNVFNKICSLHPLLKISMDDVNRFTGENLSVEDAKHFLQEFAAKIICLTCGKDGVWYKSKQDPHWAFEPAMPVEDVKDTTGAGDAFWAGFISVYLREKELGDCVRKGISIATKKVQKFGPLYLT